MKYVIDIDNTLIVSEATICECCGRYKYKTKYVKQQQIDRVNELYKQNNLIVLWTGRGWDTYEITTEQLKNAGVLYHELVMGKPLGTYVDFDAIKEL